MGVIAALSAEHEVFRRLIVRVERALSWPEAAGRRELRECLLVLLPALERHEKIEDLAFAEPDYSSSEGAGELLAELERDHNRVDRLRERLTEALEADREEWGDFRASAAELCARLREHFLTEERRLWPHYAKAMRRSRDATAGRRLDREVKRFADDVERSRAQVSEYLDNSR